MMNINYGKLTFFEHEVVLYMEPEDLTVPA
jgi:hypothetical protein